MKTLTRSLSIITLTLALMFTGFAGVADASVANDKEAPVTPSTEIHGAPGNVAGHNADQVFGAAPAGTRNGDGGQHGIGNNPGQSDVSPAERRAAGDCVAEQMHAGISAVNPNC